MPTYDYKCNSCQHRFEILQSMNDEILKLCPKCKKNDLERLIGAGSGLIFKGSGFYITDYVKKKNNSDTNKNENKPKNNTFCPIYLGVSLIDQIRTVESFKSCSFINIAYPILFIPFLSFSPDIFERVAGEVGSTAY